MRVEIFGGTHIGKQRTKNQDRYHIDTHYRFAILCDGIGGAKGGELAAQHVVSTLSKELGRIPLDGEDDIKSTLFHAIDATNLYIKQQSISHPTLQGMGTTLNALVFGLDKLFLAHIGDSRTYLYYKENFWQLTVDHNIKSFIDRGLINPEQISSGQNLKALTRSIGSKELCEFDLYEFKLQPGFIFVTSTDGLSDMVSIQEIYRCVKECNEIQKLPTLLIDRANLRGGRDNITVIVSKVTDD